MNCRDRCHQVFRYLRDVYPVDYTGIPPRLRVVRKMPKDFKDCHGAATWFDRMDSPLIYIRWGQIQYTVPTLLHEYAHLLTEGEGAFGGHGPEFWLTVGILENDFNDHGFRDSRSY